MESGRKQEALKEEGGEEKKIRGVGWERKKKPIWQEILDKVWGEKRFARTVVHG